jgi:hypothetical protein
MGLAHHQGVGGPYAGLPNQYILVLNRYLFCNKNMDQVDPYSRRAHCLGNGLHDVGKERP